MKVVADTMQFLAGPKNGKTESSEPGARQSSKSAPVKSVDPDLDAPEDQDIPFRAILQNLKNFFRGYTSTRANAH